MVVLYHATAQHAGDVVQPIWENGAAGVHIFFVISGFVMAVSTIGHEDANKPARRFMERRILRIVPLYWIVTTLFLFEVVVARMHPSFVTGKVHVAIPLSYIVASYLLIPYRNSLGLVQPLLVVRWTLSFEMLFYLLFASALALRASVVRLLTPMMLILAAIGMFHKESWPSITVLTDPILLEFLAGVLLGRLIQKGFRINWVLAGLLGLAGLVGIFTLPKSITPAMGPLLWGVPALLIVLSAVMLENEFGHGIPRWMLLLGDASYSLYLSHMLVFSVAVKLLIRSHIFIPGVVRKYDEILMAVVLLAASVLVSLVLYELVEKPLNQFMRSKKIRTANRKSVLHSA